jgi:4-hydroxybenzoate polyprenyltransferase
LRQVVAVDLQAINKQWDQIRHGVGRFRPWFELCRLPHSLAVAVDPLAGALIAGAGGAQMPYVICLMFGAFFLHAGAVVLNDWHDFKADRIEHPDRPMPAGRVGRWYGLFGAIVLLGVGWTFMEVPGARSGQLGMGVLAAALLYEFIMKGAPAGKAIPALTRALLLMMGAMLVPIESSPGGWPLRVFCMSVLAVYAIGAALLAERPEDQYRSVFALAGGIVAALVVGHARDDAGVLPGGRRLSERGRLDRAAHRSAFLSDLSSRHPSVRRISGIRRMGGAVGQRARGGDDGGIRTEPGHQSAGGCDGAAGDLHASAARCAG